MKEEQKDTILAVSFGILVVFNLVAVAVNLSSCVCSIGDTECVEACEQKAVINHAICFIANVISLITVAVLFWLWSDKK